MEINMNIQQNMSLMENFLYLPPLQNTMLPVLPAVWTAVAMAPAWGTLSPVGSVTHSLRMGAVFLCSRSSLPMNVFLTAPTARTTVTPM